MITLQNDLAPQAPVPQPIAQPLPSSKALTVEQQSSPLESCAAPGSQFATPNFPASPREPSAETFLPQLHFAVPNLQPLQNRPAGKPRNGKIAHLPKLERDMVNRMLANNLPYQKIVSALDECGFRVTERNVSNWKTRGGYNEWCAAQRAALELHTFQDNLTEFLRRHDAAELSEVGLQSAATSLSAILLRPDLIHQLIDDPQKYSNLIQLQCRLARELHALQKNRNDAARSLGSSYNPERLRRQNEQDVESIRQAMSSETGKSVRDPTIPHRNFIPRELEPAPRDREPSHHAVLQQLQAVLARCPSAGKPPQAAP